MATKMMFDFDALSNMVQKLEAADADIKRGVEAGLLASKKEITTNLQRDIAKHKRTGNTAKSLDKNYKVEWSGTTASVDIGFHIRQGGLPSIFLMYGTPKVKKDTKLYNDVYGTATKKKVRQLQEEAMQKALERMGG